METLKLKLNEYIPDNYTGIIESEDGSKVWLKNGKKHREDGPAIEFMNGNKEWWIKGKLHRIDGPAIEKSNGHKQWWIDGIRYIAEYFSTEGKIFLGTEIGKYGFEWMKFLTKEGIEEIPIIPGQELKIVHSFTVEEYKTFIKNNK